MASETYLGALNTKWVALKQQKFLLKPWWMRHTFTPKSELERMTFYFEEVSRCRTQFPKLIQEMDDVLSAMYLHETWANECLDGTTKETMELTTCFLEDNEDEFDRQCKAMHLDPKRTHVKMTNLLAAIRVLCQSEEAISEQLIELVHSTVMKGLIEHPGVYRTKDARPCGTKFLYCRPSQIASRMNALLTFMKSKFPGKDSEESILLASLFFSEFLLIHPFPNGNGRVSRILLSLSLKKVCVVPFSLSLCSGRRVYLECLEERMGEDPPTQLATLILSEARQFSWNIYYLFCLEQSTFDTSKPSNNLLFSRETFLRKVARNS